jgi:hypothetical protein
MDKIFNCTDQGVELLGWRFLPNSPYAINPQGKKTDHIPDAIAFSPQAKRLAAQGLLRIRGDSVPPVQLISPPAAPVQPEQVAVTVEEPVAVEPSDTVDEAEEGSDGGTAGDSVETGFRKRKRR